MPIRTFTARDGARWSVWRIQSSASSEMLGVPSDWLMFQDEAGTERRRLVGFPPNWEGLSDERLELLAKVAEPARGWERAAPERRTSPAEMRSGPGPKR